MNKIPLKQGTVAWKIQHIILRSKTCLPNGGGRDPVRLFEELTEPSYRRLENILVVVFDNIIPLPKTKSVVK